MAYVPQVGNYVKFLRGTPSAWDRLGTNKDSDTLYFISERNSDKGKLYLGNKLIADGENITKLGDLEDVFLAEDLPSNTILVYDIDTEGWIPKTLQEVFQLVVSEMTGASAEQNGASGLVPKPEKGEQNLYLRGDATWANPTAAVEIEVQNNKKAIDEAKTQFEATIVRLEGGYTGQTIPQIAGKVVSEAVAKLVASAPSDFDTLKEIADWIQGHDGVTSVIDLNNRVGVLEDSVFGTEEHPGGLVQDMTGVKAALYGTADDNGLVINVADLMTKVPKMQGEIVSLQNANTNINTRIDAIDKILRWTDLVWQADNIT